MGGSVCGSSNRLESKETSDNCQPTCGAFFARIALFQEILSLFLVIWGDIFLSGYLWGKDISNKTSSLKKSHGLDAEFDRSKERKPYPIQ